ncbi:MAG: Aspartate--tRNA(Asp/Asn) ligase [Candidatus Woesearchaeota archaeon]|nr:Aspartate--tRNA(Asp/Asn) ligase [Candidatus Woesearchaeota archaeon]
MEENKLVEERKRKLKKLRERGIEPYAYNFDKKHKAAEVQDKFEKFKDKSVKVAGRIMSMRDMGKVVFMDIYDSTANIQLYFRQENLGKDKLEIISLLDIGDIIGCEGTVFKTRTKEITVKVKKFKLLTKSLKPLPEKWHGLKDKEQKYRQRYVHLIMEPEEKKTFLIREQIIQGIREYLTKREYVEVQTPILQPLYGGASARPFKANLHALNMPVYMRISNEMYLKRLIVAGFDRVFEFSIDFRNEGIDKNHNPEFLLFEAMTAYTDYFDGMKLIENITEYVVKKVKGTTKVKYQGKEIDFKAPWDRISVRDSIIKYADIDIEKTDDEEMKKILAKHNIKLKGEYTRGNAILTLVEEFCEEHFVQPTILYDYPRETSPLAKPKRDDPRYTERFEQFVNCFELGNNYTEVTNAQILRENWEKEEEALSKGDYEAMRMDYDYLNAIEVGMPPVCGIAIGIDRLIMILSDKASIRDVILFPFMKPKFRKKEPQVKIDELPSEKVIVSKEAKKLGLKTSYAIIKDVSIEKSSAKLKKMKKDISANPNEKRIKCMQDAYKSFGIDPTKRLPSSVALIKRVEEGKGIYNVNTLVDAYNISSIRESLPMACYDLSKVDFPIKLRKAKEGEEITLIGGKIKSINKGEIVYSDNSRVICLDFNYRDADFTKVTSKTKNVIVFVDGCKGISNMELLKALDNSCELITQLCGGEIIEKRIA